MPYAGGIDLDIVFFKKLEEVANFMPLTKHANTTVRYNFSCPEVLIVDN